MRDDYRASLDFLYGRLDYERLGMPKSPAELGLGRMRRLLRRLGDPQDGLRIVHVAGTKGKGSVAAMLAAALQASGRTTGLFCSPHLHRLEERFRVDGVDATPGELVELVESVRPAVEDLDDRDPRLRGRGSTFFEVTTAMGLIHFARRGADAVVMEVGMGGRLDSTNVVHPLVSVLTTISLDHTRQLGTTPAAIAAEKAGILKRGRPAVSGVRDPDARRVIERIARQRRVGLRALDVDFSCDYRPPTPPLARPTAGRAAVRTWRTDWGTIDLPLLGEHQALNAAVALATLDTLAEQGVELNRAAVVRGLAGLNWPARAEILGRSPWLVIDGAHNAASAEALAETIRTCFPTTGRTLVFGTTRDKDLDGQLRALLPLFDRVVATRYVENPRSVPAGEVAEAVLRLSGKEAAIGADPAEALEVAREVSGPDGLICVTGSLFLAAEMRALVLGLPDAAGSSRERIVR